MTGKTRFLVLCAAVCAVWLAASGAAWAEDDMFDFTRTDKGQSEWTLSLGNGETRYVTDNTSVPKMDFDVFGVRYAYYMSPRKQVGYSLLFGEQTTAGKNTGISTFIDYSEMFYAKKHFGISYEVGIGLMRFKDKVPGQATRVNFNERATITLHWVTGRKTALSVSGGMYHASNAGLQLPNPGVNVALLMVNQTWYQ